MPMKANKKLLILLCAVSALALTACGSKSYADGVDAISGATVNYNEFKEAVGDALRQAEQ